MEFLSGASGLVIYLALKLGGYIAWSYVGLRWLGRDLRRPFLGAMGLGVLRLVIGWITGIVVGLFVLRALDQLPLFYFTGLVVIRWFEWALIHVLIPGSGGGGLGFVTGGSTAGRLWRGVGILCSYAADAPFLLTAGFPHGRIFC